MADVSALGGCATLHTLDISDGDDWREMMEGNGPALAGCAKLQVLSLSGCINLTDVSGCAALQKLDLTCCVEVTDRDVSMLASCTLRTLALCGCNRVTDVSALADCATLHELDLRFCDRVTDRWCAALRVLVLSHTGVRDVSALAGRADLRLILSYASLTPQLLQHSQLYGTRGSGRRR